MRNKHDSKVRRANILSFLEKITVHICKICSKKVLCDSNELVNHFRKCHGMKLSEYRKQFDCSGSHLSLKAKYDLKLKEGTLSQDIVGNLCIFQCPMCLENFNSLDSFYRHTIEEYRKGKM